MSNPRPCALGVCGVCESRVRVSRPPYFVRRGSTGAHSGRAMGVLRSYTAIMKGGSAWYDYRAMLGDDVPLHTLFLPS